MDSAIPKPNLIPEPSYKTGAQVPPKIADQTLKSGAEKEALAKTDKSEKNRQQLTEISGVDIKYTKPKYNLKDKNTKIQSNDDFIDKILKNIKIPKIPIPSFKLDNKQVYLLGYIEGDAYSEDNTSMNLYEFLKYYSPAKATEAYKKCQSEKREIAYEVPDHASATLLRLKDLLKSFFVNSK
jgi:hypothetical protein